MGRQAGPWQDGVSVFYYEDDYLTVKAFQALRDAIGDGADLAAPGAKARKAPGDQVRGRRSRCIREACRITSRGFPEGAARDSRGHDGKGAGHPLWTTCSWSWVRRGTLFPPSVPAAKTARCPTPSPASRKVRKGDLITLDVGCKVGGYCSDMTRTVALGEPSAEMRRVYDTGLGGPAPGPRRRWPPARAAIEIDKLVRDYIDSQGYAGRFRPRPGPRGGHRHPRESPPVHGLPRHRGGGAHALTVEPGIYLPGVGGVRIEDTCSGHARAATSPLTGAAPKELIIL